MIHTVPVLFTADAGMDFRRDSGEVVDLRYEDKAPFAFTAPSTSSSTTCGRPRHAHTNALQQAHTAATQARHGESCQSPTARSCR